MSEGLTDSVKQVLEERIKNPLWGFIILAWMWFNWPNLAMLFMSDAPVKFRIDYILSQDYFYLHFILEPVIAGGVLAVLSPYAQWLLSKAHKWADDRYRDNVYQSKRQDFVDAIKLSKLKVQSDRAVEAENAKIDADIKAEVERGKREQLVTQELELQKKNLEERIESLAISLEEGNHELVEISEQKERHNNFMNSLVVVLDKHMHLGDKISISELKNEINELLSVGGYEAAALSGYLLNKKNKPIKKSKNLLNLIKKIREEDSSRNSAVSTNQGD